MVEKKPHTHTLTHTNKQKEKGIIEDHFPFSNKLH